MAGTQEVPSLAVNNCRGPICALGPLLCALGVFAAVARRPVLRGETAMPASD
jgi:hypothetical protein